LGREYDLEEGEMRGNRWERIEVEVGEGVGIDGRGRGGEE